MKKIFFSFTFSLLIMLVFAQTPQLINYQGVARDNVGNALTNQNISLLLKVLKTNTNGTVVYSETHNVTTNQFAEFNLQIGSGVIVSGAFADIEWGIDSYFFRVEMDPTGGVNYQYMGTTQFVSVPYALFSEKSKTTDKIDPDYPDGYVGTTPINYTGQLYTVPIGKNLHVSSLYYGGSGEVLLNGAPIKGINWSEPKEMLILKSGDVISHLTDNFFMMGYLITPIVQPVLISQSPYTVPNGKRLVIYNATMHIDLNDNRRNALVLINGQGPVHEFGENQEPVLLFVEQGSNVAVYQPLGSYFLFGYLMDM
jgi:hypothetical protein